jgi:membrane protein involved in colicin uptake
MIKNCSAHTVLRVLLAVILALSCLLLAPALQPAGAAHAVTTDTEPVHDELQQRVEETAVAYNESLIRLDDIEQRIEDTEKQIEEINACLSTQRGKSSLAAAEFYRMQRSSNTLLELLFSSQSISDLAARLEYINRLQDSYYNEITKLSSLNEQLTAAHTALQESRREAQIETARAEEALADAKAAREEARLQAEAQAAAQALAANMPVASSAAVDPESSTSDSAADSSSSSSSNSSASGGSDSGAGSSSSAGGGGNGSSNGSAGGGGWDLDRDTYIAHWGARIDAYLGSYPLGGYGREFAAAAWNYGVDPRVAPAISTLESGNGRACFRPHNAWGWGQYSWPDWPTAIDEYTAGLSRGYGQMMTVEGAKRYAPLVWETWYPLLISEINRI